MVCGIHNTNQFEGIQVDFANIDMPYESFVSSIYKISLFFQILCNYGENKQHQHHIFPVYQAQSHLSCHQQPAPAHHPSSSAYQRPLPVQQEPPSNNQQPHSLQQMMHSSETTSVLLTGFQHKVNLIDTHPLKPNLVRYIIERAPTAL